MGLFDKLTGLFKSETVPESPFLLEYVDLQQFAGGSMGTIYRAKHKQTGEVRVVKKMKCATPESKRRLYRELEVCLGVKHENVIRYLAYEQKDGFHWVLAEYFSGLTLRQFLQDSVARKALCPFVSGRDFLMVFLQCVRGLQHVHSRGFLHLDIKPENIMASGLAKSGSVHATNNDKGPKSTTVLFQESEERAKGIKVKILDFGVSIKEGEQVPVGGSIFYVAPEVIEGKKVGPDGVAQRSDIYSLGATLFELATGDPPYLPEYFAHKGKHWSQCWKDYEALPKMTRTEYEKEMLASRKTKEPDYARIPYGEKVRNLLKKCLEYQPAKRYAQTFTLLKEIETICASISSS